MLTVPLVIFARVVVVCVMVLVHQVVPLHLVVLLQLAAEMADRGASFRRVVRARVAQKVRCAVAKGVDGGWVMGAVGELCGFVDGVDDGVAATLLLL